MCTIKSCHHVSTLRFTNTHFGIPPGIRPQICCRPFDFAHPHLNQCWCCLPVILSIHSWGPSSCRVPFQIRLPFGLDGYGRAVFSFFCFLIFVRHSPFFHICLLWTCLSLCLFDVFEPSCVDSIVVPVIREFCYITSSTGRSPAFPFHISEYALHTNPRTISRSLIIPDRVIFRTSPIGDLNLSELLRVAPCGNGCAVSAAR